MIIFYNHLLADMTANAILFDLGKIYPSAVRAF